MNLQNLPLFSELIETLSDLYNDVYLAKNKATDLMQLNNRLNWLKGLESYPILQKVYSLIFMTYADGDETQSSFAEKLVKEYGIIY